MYCRLFLAAKELQQTDSKFIAFYRMSKESYTELVDLISPVVWQRNTNMRECVSADERILITLRYLASGCTFVSLSLYFARGESTVGVLIGEMTKIFWEVLNEVYMPVPRGEQWKGIADRYEALWNLPNCIGSIDGKHVRIERFSNSGSSNFNYKSYHSVVLLACCDADGLFTTIEAGYAGRNSDGGIFRASAIKYWLLHGGLDIPQPSRLMNDENDCPFPDYFVGDEAFPLTNYLMRPYPKRVLDNLKRIFNHRLSRGRKTIECAFGMMTKKWQVLNSPIRCRDPEKVNHIIRAVCILHNYVRKREGIHYTPTQREDNFENTIDNATVPTAQNITINAQSSANALRNYLANYFVTPQASLPWQWNYCVT